MRFPHIRIVFEWEHVFRFVVLNERHSAGCWQMRSRMTTMDTPYRARWYGIGRTGVQW